MPLPATWSVGAAARDYEVVCGFACDGDIVVVGVLGRERREEIALRKRESREA